MNMSNQFFDNLQIFYSSRYENVAKNGLVGLFMTDYGPNMRLVYVDNMCMSYFYPLLIWSNGYGIM